MAPIASTVVVTADDIAHHVEWYGHQSRAAIVRKFGQAAEAAIDQALSLGLIAPASRLGGYCATRKVKAELFGDRYAEAWA